MSETPGNPKITVEIKPDNSGALIVGEKSPLASSLREILNFKGIKINDPQGFNYVFQLGNFEKIEFFLGKACRAKSKFFLILDEDVEAKLSGKAEKTTLQFIQSRELDAKIIKLSGFAGEEVEAVKKILEAAFSQTPQKVISLTGPGIFWEKRKKPQGAVPKKRLFLWGTSIVFLIILLTFPVTFILANVFLGTMALKSAKAAVFTANFEKGKKRAVFAQEHFGTAKESFAKIAPVFSFFGREGQARQIENELEIGQDLGLAVKHLIEVGQEGQELTKLILSQKQGETGEVLARLTNNIGLAEEELGLINAQAFARPQFLKGIFEQIGDLRKNLVEVKNLLKVAPWVLGIDGKRTYLVLFQNNFELRPGGGFIGTIGLLTFGDGKLDFKIEDVYTADGQLRGHVEPPKAIKQYLNQIHWYLRDSNWEPDFPTNARQAAWFLEKELGVKPDGVIALDLALVKKILGLSGPVDLADYKEKITEENFFLKAQIYSQEKFFPGSTQKRDFLGAVARALFEKLIAEKNLSWFGLGKGIEEAIKEKHLAIFFENELAQRIISETGWGGEVKIVNCPTEKCLEDYLMVVEANLGVNKSNYFIKREIKKEVSFTQEGLTSEVVINYENTSPAAVSFGGVYKNYLRVLTPVEFTLEKITIDNQELSQAQIDQTTIFGKKTTGFLVEVPPWTKKEVKVSCKTAIDPSWDEFTYQLFVQKQPGTEKDSLSLVFLTPSWKIEEANFPTLVKIGNLSYNTDLSIDRLFKIRFKR